MSPRRIERRLRHRLARGVSLVLLLLGYFSYVPVHLLTEAHDLFPVSCHTEDEAIHHEGGHDHHDEDHHLAGDHDLTLIKRYDAPAVAPSCFIAATELSLRTSIWLTYLTSRIDARWTASGPPLLAQGRAPPDCLFVSPVL